MLSIFLLAAGLAPGLMANPIQHRRRMMNNVTVASDSTVDLGLPFTNKRAITLHPVTNDGFVLPTVTDIILPSPTLTDGLPLATGDLKLPFVTDDIVFPTKTDDLTLPSLALSRIDMPLETAAPDLDFIMRNKRQAVTPRTSSSSSSSTITASMSRLPPRSSSSITASISRLLPIPSSSSMTASISRLPPRPSSPSTTAAISRLPPQPSTTGAPHVHDNPCRECAKQCAVAKDVAGILKCAKKCVVVCSATLSD